MKGVIFGSGAVGLAARRLLAGDWTVVPFARSRFYSFNPPLGDNFISRDKEVDQAMVDLSGQLTRVLMYRRCYSVGGSLVSRHDPLLAEAWLSKVMGGNVPGQGLPYMTTRMACEIYPARVSALYRSLMDADIDYLKAEAAKGQVTEIGDHYFVRGGVKTEFDHAISTIPLPALASLAGASIDLPAADEHFVLVRSSRIDLEGHNQALVVDGALDFYKVTALSPDTYMFCSTREMQQAGAYLMPIIGSADVIDGTRIEKSIPLGPAPDPAWLSAYGIFCVGSAAQWDWFADFGSNLLRIIRYAARGYKP